MDRARTRRVKVKNTRGFDGEGKPSPYALIKKLLFYFFGGFFMGIANLIPGVSGGTVALMIGIFEKLVDTLANVSFKNLSNLLRKNFFKKLEYYGFDFLLVLTVGAAFSIVVGSKPINFLLENHLTVTMIFFSGLIIGSLPVILSNINSKSKLFYSLFGFVLVLVMNFLEKSYQGVRISNDNMLILMLSGALAMCTMILPGVSGAFVLVLLGQYQKVINAIDELNFKVLTVFGIGALVGIIVFSKFLKFIFSKYKDAILSFFLGAMIGAAVFLPKDGVFAFFTSYRNFFSLLTGFLVSMVFSIYEIKNKKSQLT